MAYELFITPRARKQMRKLPTDVDRRIRKQLDTLCMSPRGNALDTKKLSGRDGYRLRVGDYRVIYDIEDKKLIFVVLEAGHRKDIYQ